MEYERINSLNRNRVDAFIRQHWYTTTMIIRGKVIDMTKTEGFFFKIVLIYINPAIAEENI